jgi:hypothetical protein
VVPGIEKAHSNLKRYWKKNAAITKSKIYGVQGEAGKNGKEIAGKD